MPEKTICFTLEDHEARALAQFFARMHWTVIRKMRRPTTMPIRCISP